jgi:hypothetical protein
VRRTQRRRPAAGRTLVGLVLEALMQTAGGAGYTAATWVAPTGTPVARALWCGGCTSCACLCAVCVLKKEESKGCEKKESVYQFRGTQWTKRGKEEATQREDQPWQHGSSDRRAASRQAATQREDRPWEHGRSDRREATRPAPAKKVREQTVRMERNRKCPSNRRGGASAQGDRLRRLMDGA